MEKSHVCDQTFIPNFQANEVVLLLFANHVFGHLNGQLLCSQWPGNLRVSWREER